MIIKLATFESVLEKDATLAEVGKKALIKLKNLPTKANVADRRASRWLNNKIGIKDSAIFDFAKDKFKHDPAALKEYLKNNKISAVGETMKRHSASIAASGAAVAGGGILAAKHKK